MPQADHTDNPSYAVKRLRHNDKHAFEAEVSTLKRLGAQDHLHLIRLLVTYSYRNEFYLLFPWADGGNLRDLWKDGYPDPTIPCRDERLAEWLSRQILGVVEGLKMIHTSDIQPLSHGASLDTPDGRRKHGRHGDLKPENILWFKTYHSDDKACFMGLLKISDFGMTSFHDSQTRSMLDARSIGVSPTYRAPEYDIKEHVSQKYDIWTLGCVLIEFVTWYVLGWKGVDDFSKSRANDDNQEIKEDLFFNLEQRGNNGQSGFRARMKRVVADVG
jgi:serine/threonine protein kinase